MNGGIRPFSLARRRLLFALPLGAAAAGSAACYGMLSGMRRGTFDPHEVGAPVLGRPVPDFAVPALDGGKPIDAAALRALRAPVLLNFFASWCIPCIEEADAVASLRGRLPVWGIAYKDKPNDARGFLGRTGDPYSRVALDQSGDAAIDWGVTGVPESFLVAPGGIVRWHYDQGPLDEPTIRSELLPRLS